MKRDGECRDMVASFKGLWEERFAPALSPGRCWLHLL